MTVLKICILLSSFSFFAYATSYFMYPTMKSEFKRFGLEKFGFFVIITQLLGAIGLIIGLAFQPILIIASLGLALQMFAGVLVRIKMKDNIWISLPAFFYMVLNAYIFWVSIQ